MAKRKRARKPTKKPVCRFCRAGEKKIDYKDVLLLQKLTTPQGKILGRKRLGTCASHQRMIKHAIRRARIIALLPFVKLY